MEEAAQNCLPSIQASTSRFACSSEIPERVLTIERLRIAMKAPLNPAEAGHGI
jgi:hypothetical protein